ncbi:MAG TPA: type I restriction endonuclease subunit R, partial [Treponemataceae bacterium]|nr:type I restriction endonuclease subunit R [Treponemataceae bacterium]
MPSPEYALAEKPVIKYLQSLGYEWMRPELNEDARDGLNNVILRDIFIDSIRRINGIDEETARAAYQELLAIHDNDNWMSKLRGNYSRILPGESKHTTIWLIDYKNLENNTLTVTNQFTVEAAKTRRADCVVFVNGIPLVVIEAKSPVSSKDKAGEAFEQIKQYEEEVPRLFYSNLFNIITNGYSVLYGATHSPSDYWAEWRDPYPKTQNDFRDKFELGLWALLEPSRLLNILAHFVVFELDDKSGRQIKKVCRYQQFRAVNKIVERILENRKTGERKGLIWHTQGSGKSLTMAYAVLRLKLHLDISSDCLSSPNILIITDRIDLDDQITKTFQACNLPNPQQAKSATTFRELINSGTTGQTILSTIFKLDKSSTAIKDSKNWIVCVDEAHRTQEQDLGAYLRATFPDAYFFGFTGTPVQSNNHDTYATFSPSGEFYLDKYGIDDAVADGATVPIHYTARKAEWAIEAEKLDILFDNWFANEDEKTREKIKKSGVTIEALAKNRHRVELIAYDIWTHFKTFAYQDGYKAQIVAIDREAIILYKRALDKAIAEDFMSEGMGKEAAEAKADSFSVCVYSSNRDDAMPSEDPYIDRLRKDFIKYQHIDNRGGKWSNVTDVSENLSEAEVKKAFKIKGEPPYFIIVCAKLLTGFDAPAESVMYLDNPLKEHNLLQAIARTNRIEGDNKQFGLIVDYIGVTRNLNEALSTYRKEDIHGALHSLDELKANLKATHREAMRYVKFPIHYDNDINEAYWRLIQDLGTVDVWFQFKIKANAFIKAYEALCPDPFILDYTEDVKWVSTFLTKGINKFEHNDAFSPKNYSAKIRDMLDKHLTVSGIKTLIQLKHITDPDFFEDFKAEGKSEPDIRDTVLRKVTELKKTITERTEENPQEYEPFSKRILELIKRLDSGLVDVAELLKDAERLARDLVDEDNAHRKTGLTKNAYGIWKILEAFKPKRERDKKQPTEANEKEATYSEEELKRLQKVAQEIEGIYASDETAPVGWQHKEELKKELRSEVRHIAFEAELDWQRVPTEVEKFALKHFAKV